MSLLFRYLTKNNAMILLPTLAVGIGLYVLTDLFERLDNFIEAGLSVGMVLTYFVVKMPLVISQILPVIFLLSTVIQLCIMARSRELTALQAGGISLSQADPYRPGEETLVSTTENTYTVVGTCERPTLEPHDAPGYTLLTTAAPPGQATSLRLFVTLYHPRQAQDYAAHTGYSGQALYNEPVLRFLGAS